MNLYVVRNKEGKYFRAIGRDGRGLNWVDTLDKAKFYPKIGQAKGRVTFFFKNYPQYGCPEILVFELEPSKALVLNVEDMTKSSIRQATAAKLKREYTEKVRQAASLERQREEINQKLAKLK